MKPFKIKGSLMFIELPRDYNVIVWNNKHYIIQYNFIMIQLFILAYYF